MDSGPKKTRYEKNIIPVLLPAYSRFDKCTIALCRPIGVERFPSICQPIADSDKGRKGEIHSEGGLENKFEFVLDSIVDYPQNIRIQYYPDCTTEMRKEIEADIRVLPKAVANIFITDATNPVLVKGESILLLHQNILQKKYQQMLNDMNVRINQFKKRTGQQLHQAFLSASNHQQKDSIEVFQV